MNILKVIPKEIENDFGGLGIEVSHSKINKEVTPKLDEISDVTAR